MNQELKQQVHKKFDKLAIYELLNARPEEGHLYEEHLPKILSFLDSLIDRTVQATEERIVGIIESIESSHKITPRDYRKALSDLKILITNKSNINK